MSDFKAKMRRNLFRLQFCRSIPTLLGELSALHRFPSCNKGDILLREERGEVGEGEGKGKGAEGSGGHSQMYL